MKSLSFKDNLFSERVASPGDSHWKRLVFRVFRSVIRLEVQVPNSEGKLPTVFSSPTNGECTQSAMDF